MSVIASERVVRANPLRRLLVRPETGAVVGSIAVWIFFAIIGVAQNNGFVSSRGTSSWLSVSAELAILAVPVALLMIGGEFDLSVGSMVGASGMIIAILSTQFGLNIWVSIVVALIFAVLVGVLNGYLVMRTRLPSFIVTLGTGYILLGTPTGVTSLVTNGLTVVNGLDQAPGYSSAHAIFATALGGGQQYPIEIVWALALVTLATWLLLGTSFGNWVFGVGGDSPLCGHGSWRVPAGDYPGCDLYQRGCAARCWPRVLCDRRGGRRGGAAHWRLWFGYRRHVRGAGLW